MFLLVSRTWFSDRIHLQNFLFRLHPSIPFLSSSIDVCQEKFINKAPKDTFVFMFYYFIKNCWLTPPIKKHFSPICPPVNRCFNQILNFEEHKNKPPKTQKEGEDLAGDRSLPLPLPNSFSPRQRYWRRSYISPSFNS